MKKAILITVILLINIETIVATKNLVYINPLQIFFKRIEIGYEFEIISKSSIAIIPWYEGIGLKNEWHTRLQFSYNYSFAGSFQGYWLAPTMSIFYAEIININTSQYATLSTFEPGIGLGKRWLVNDKVYLGVGIGAGPSIEIHRDSYIKKRKGFFYSMCDVGFLF